jgi:glycosyltransferase involved in cell wall biosynthesis
MIPARTQPSLPPPEREERSVPRAAQSEGGGRPRLLILTVGFGIGGAEQLILTTAPRLQRDGFEVTIVGLKGWGLLGDELEARGVRAVALGGRGAWDLRAFGRLLSILRRDRIQILHGHMFRANVAARILGRLASVPVVVTAHHDTDVWMRFHHRLVERLTAPLSDSITACSEAVRHHALQVLGLPPELVRTLPNGIELPDESHEPRTRERIRRELGASPDDLLIGSLGRLVEPKKGLAVFLAAARLMAREFPRVRFAVVGEGPARGPLEARAAREGVSHCTTFAGSRRDVPDVMRAFDLFVQPSLWEGFGLTAVEAMAVGTPVVASRVGGVMEVVVDGETGVLVPPGDAPALAAACGLLLRNRGLAERLARAGCARVRERFGIERMVRELQEHYRDLLDRSHGVAVPAAAGGRRSGS